MFTQSSSNVLMGEKTPLAKCFDNKSGPKQLRRVRPPTLHERLGFRVSVYMDWTGSLSFLTKKYNAENTD
jgi:hypothetical protein